MSIERWGAFSVIDYKDARKLAAEVLMYDRLLVPIPMAWDRHRWTEKGWEPERLEKRLKQLGDVAILAAWDQDAQKNWSEKFNALRQDVRDINSALEMTRRVLVDQARKYRPEGVNAIEAFSAYQSEADFRKLGLKGRRTRKRQMSEFDFLVAQRISIPDEQDPEESLERALDLLQNKDFRDRRSRFHEWQHAILARGVMAADAAKELSQLIADYNGAVQKATKSYRVETVMLAGGLTVTALTALASLAPGVFAGIGIGVLAGAKVVSIGGTATGAVLQIAKHIRNRKEPDSASRADLSGAMFHQMEEETGWKLRSTAQSAAVQTSRNR